VIGQLAPADGNIGAILVKVASETGLPKENPGCLNQPGFVISLLATPYQKPGSTESACGDDAGSASRPARVHFSTFLAARLQLMMEIIERGPVLEEIGRPTPHDIRASLKPSGPDASDHRTQIEHADWIGKESPTMRDLYERGADIKGDTLIIPAEEHELREDRDTPFITTLSYAQEKIGDIEKAREFHSLAVAIAGETADARMKIAVFKIYYERIARDGQGNRFVKDWGAERSDALKRTLEEMRAVAAEMAKLETRESVEAIEMDKIVGFDSASNRGVESIGREMNVTARKVNLRDESLRLPTGLSYETKERLLRFTMPEIDRRLEKGISREALFTAINNTMFHRDTRDATERELNERARVAGFLKGYIDERMRDPETRAMNTSPVFREARAVIVDAKTAEALGQAATLILRLNERRSEELRRHRAAPSLYPMPAIMPLNARERNLLFNGRAPDHHTREMRELRLSYGLSREERAARTADLHEGRIEPSTALNHMLQELETRKTAKALAHFQASVLNEIVDNAGRLNLYRLHQQIPPHERAYLFERAEERKNVLQRAPQNHRAEIVDPGERTDRQFAGRGFGKAPKDSHSFREYMSNMGRIERQLLNTAVSRLIPRSGGEQNDLTITEARNLLPEKTRDEIRLRARNLAWQSLVPDEVFEREPMPEALRISDTISHMQEYLQDRARIAQAARNDFALEKIRLAEEKSRKPQDGREALNVNYSEHKQFVRTTHDSFSPADAGSLAEFEKYAAQTREDVYRGFETLDALRGDLELKRESLREHSDQDWKIDNLREVLDIEMNRYQIEPQEREEWQHQR
jgi:hypothetical protein